MGTDVFDGFTVNVFFDEDGYYLAHFVELPNIWAFGSTPSGALVELEASWELVKERYQADDGTITQESLWKSDRGAFNVPVDTQLYHTLTVKAAEVGMDLYTFVASRLATITNVDAEYSGEI